MPTVSPVQLAPLSAPYAPPLAPPTAMPHTAEMLAQIETLQRERDAFKMEAEIERSKNIELEKELHVLRDLIA